MLGAGHGEGLRAGHGEGLRDGRAGSLTGLIEGCLNVARHGGCHGWAWVCHVSVSECQSQGSGVAEHSSHSGDLLHVRRIPVPQHGVHFVS
jgi:hypothetical protein